jgi:hypothetical protein
LGAAALDHTPSTGKGLSNSRESSKSAASSELRAASAAQPQISPA